MEERTHYSCLERTALVANDSELSQNNVLWRTSATRVRRQNTCRNSFPDRFLHDHFVRHRNHAYGFQVLLKNNNTKIAFSTSIPSSGMPYQKQSGKQIPWRPSADVSENPSVLRMTLYHVSSSSVSDIMTFPPPHSHPHLAHWAFKLMESCAIKVGFIIIIIIIKTAGPDGVSPATLKHCSSGRPNGRGSYSVCRLTWGRRPTLALVFTTMFTFSLHFRHYPPLHCLRHPGAQLTHQRSLLSDYRPMALTSVVMKMLERLVQKQLHQWPATVRVSRKPIRERNSRTGLHPQPSLISNAGRTVQWQLPSLEENSNSKTLTIKDSSVRSIWTYLTASPCFTTNTNKHNYTTNISTNKQLINAVSQRSCKCAKNIGIKFFHGQYDTDVYIYNTRIFRQTCVQSRRTVILRHKCVEEVTRLAVVKGPRDYNNNNNVHLSCAHQRPECSHDTY